MFWNAKRMYWSMLCFKGFNIVWEKSYQSVCPGKKREVKFSDKKLRFLPLSLLHIVWNCRTPLGLMTNLIEIAVWCTMHQIKYTLDITECSVNNHGRLFLCNIRKPPFLTRIKTLKLQESDFVCRFKNISVFIWKLNRTSKKRKCNSIQVAETRYPRTVNSFTRSDQLRNEDVRNEFGISPFDEWITKYGDKLKIHPKR
jgi:hypothetical protein